MLGGAEKKEKLVQHHFLYQNKAGARMPRTIQTKWFASNSLSRWLKEKTRGDVLTNKKNKGINCGGEKEGGKNRAQKKIEKKERGPLSTRIDQGLME